MHQSNLLDIVKETSKLIENIDNDAIFDMDNYDDIWSIYFQFFYLEFDKIDSTLKLLGYSKFKDCFIILRSILEYYFYLLLMIKGTKYVDLRTFRVIPDKFEKKEARDETYNK